MWLQGIRIGEASNPGPRGLPRALLLAWLGTRPLSVAGAAGWKSTGGGKFARHFWRIGEAANPGPRRARGGFEDGGSVLRVVGRNVTSFGAHFNDFLAEVNEGDIHLLQEVRLTRGAS